MIMVNNSWLLQKDYWDNNWYQSHGKNGGFGKKTNMGRYSTIRRRQERRLRNVSGKPNGTWSDDRLEVLSRLGTMNLKESCNSGSLKSKKMTVPFPFLIPARFQSRAHFQLNQYVMNLQLQFKMLMFRRSGPCAS